MTSHVSALSQTLSIYLVMGVAYYGWGRGATYVLGFNQHTIRFDLTLIWLGWALTLFIFQLLHLLSPLTTYVVAPVFGVGTVLSIPQIIKACRSFRYRSLTSVQTTVMAFLIIAGASWIASRAMLFPTNYDSGLYHFNAIRWINSFPIVPGLGNLHGRLGFNQSFFTYVAALNFYPLFGHGRSLANSFLFILTILSFVQFLWPVFRRPQLLAESHPFRYFSVLFAFPILGYLAVDSRVSGIDGLASPTPDFVSTLLQLTMFVILAQGIAAWTVGERRQDHRAAVLAILAATSITIKLSNLAFAAVILSMCLAFAWRTSSARIRDILRTLVPALLVIVVWSVRGFILSGCPLFPSTIGCVPVDWAVPIERVQNLENVVYGWARGNPTPTGEISWAAGSGLDLG